MNSPLIMTYADAVSHCERYMEGRGNAGKASVRGAIRAAYQSIANAHDWPALTRNWRIQTTGTQTTGTVVYDKMGGASERLLTLTGATFPTDAAEHSIRFDGIVCDINQWLSTTTVQLDSVMCPGADVASTSYTLYPRWYALPLDFMCMTAPMDESSSIGTKVTMTEMLRLDRQHASTGEIIHFAIGERPDVLGAKALFVWPALTSDATLDFIYDRRPRNLRHSGIRAAGDVAGTVTVAASSTLVTGTGSSFTSSMDGAILRFGTATVRPDWEYGDNPYVEQRSIRSVNSADGVGAITLDSAAAGSHTTVRYRITDQVDIHQETHNAFLRFCEYHLTIARNLPDPEKKLGMARDALIDAMEAAVPTRYDPSSEISLSNIFPGTTADVADW